MYIEVISLFLNPGIFLISILAISNPVQADEVFKFKNPSFSGQGTGAHYLTIENQEHSRKKAIKDAMEAARKAAEREANIDVPELDTIRQVIRAGNNVLDSIRSQVSLLKTEK